MEEGTSRVTAWRKVLGCPLAGASRGTAWQGDSVKEGGRRVLAGGQRGGGY